MDDEKPGWDDALGADLLGALVLVGITRENHDGITQEQFFGTVRRADATGVELCLDGSREGDIYLLPPDPRAFYPAQPGSYRLRSTDEVLENPDFTAMWTITDGGD